MYCVSKQFDSLLDVVLFVCFTKKVSSQKTIQKFELTFIIMHKGPITAEWTKTTQVKYLV